MEGPPRETAPKAPAVWPSLLAPIVGVIVASLASGIAVLIVAMLSNPRLMQGDFQKNFETWMEESAASFPAIFASLVPSQVLFFGVALLFAGLAREPWKLRLGFVRPKVRLSTVALAVLGTLGVHFVIGIVAERLIHEPSSSLKMLARMFTEPRGLAAVGVGFLMSVLPGFCEETLFRGFTQRGLLRRWPPAFAIGVTSLFFALAHFDLQHSLAVVPLGLWLGFVAWKTGSVWPSVLCHFTNNAVAFVVLRLWGDPDSCGSPKGAAHYVVGTALVAVAIVASIRLTKTRLAPASEPA